MLGDEQLWGMSRQRHYGLDWLTIAAFAPLILYHSAMAYSPYSWVINNGHRAHWLA
jgi:glucans biosynthesis protein C